MIRRPLCRPLVAASLVLVGFLSSTAAIAAVLQFAPKASYATGGRPFDVTAADLTQDGVPDLAVTNYNGRSVSVLPGTGGGAFGTMTEYPLPLAIGNPIDVVAADFNGDSRGDLAVSTGEPKLFVLLADATGSFGAPSETATSGGGYQLAAGDVNRDGHIDVVVASSPGQADVLLNDGTGHFPSANAYPTDGLETVGVALGDLNGDRELDIVAGNFSSTDISVLFNEGSGTFGAPSRFATPAGSTREVAIRDVNRDRRLDVVATTGACQCVAVFLGNRRTILRDAATASTWSTTASVAIEDVNGDRRQDIVAGSLDGIISVAIGKGDGTFELAVPSLEATAGAWGLSVADLNGDKKPDVVATEDQADSVAVFINTTS